MKSTRAMRNMLASVALAMAASAAHATVNYGGVNTYLGAFAPPSQENLVRQAGFGAGAFIDYWIFTVAPSATIQVNANFLPTGSIAGWTGGLYNVTAACTTVGTVCTGVVYGSLITPFVPTSGTETFGTTTLSAGTYAIQLRGNNVGANPNQTNYTGNVVFFAPLRLVPEPASLALLGIGLIGLALTRRRKAN